MTQSIRHVLEEHNVQSLPFRKGEILFRENERCSRVGYVKRGALQISSYDHHGNEILYNTIRAGQIFGNNLIFSSEPYYRGDVSALEDGEVLLIDQEELLELLSEDRDFLKNYLRIQSDFSKQLNARIKLLSFEKAEDRLFYHLQSHGGSIVYSSVSALSRELQIKRETLSRLLSRLEKEKTLLRTKNRITLR